MAIGYMVPSAKRASPNQITLNEHFRERKEETVCQFSAAQKGLSNGGSYAVFVAKFKSKFVKGRSSLTTLTNSVDRFFRNFK